MRHKTLNADSVLEILRLPRRNRRIGMRDAAMFALLLGCGLTSVEVSRITWDAYRDRKTLTLAGRRGLVRTVPVPAWAQVELNRWFRYNAEERIVPLTQAGIWYRVARYVRMAGIGRRAAPATFRQAYAQGRWGQRTPIRDIAAALGHKRVAWTALTLSKSDALAKSARAAGK